MVGAWREGLLAPDLTCVLRFLFGLLSVALFIIVVSGIQRNFLERHMHFYSFLVVFSFCL